MNLAHSPCSIVCISAQSLCPASLPLHRVQMGQAIEGELREAINDGFYQFRVGMSPGADIWAAERMIRLRDTQFPHIQLHCYVPYNIQADYLPEIWRPWYLDCLALADEVHVLQEHYSKGCYTRRTREMIHTSTRLLALHDNIADGPVERAIRYAESEGIPAHIVQPLEGPPVRLPSGVRVLSLISNQTANSSQKVSMYSPRCSMGKSDNIRACW